MHVVWRGQACTGTQEEHQLCKDRYYSMWFKAVLAAVVLIVQPIASAYSLVFCASAHRWLLAVTIGFMAVLLAHLRSRTTLSAWNTRHIVHTMDASHLARRHPQQSYSFLPSWVGPINGHHCPAVLPVADLHPVTGF